MSSSRTDGQILKAMTFIIVIAVILEFSYIQIDLNSKTTEHAILARSGVTRIYSSSDKSTTGNTIYTTDIGTTTLCVNVPPQITYDCNISNMTLNSNSSINCKLNATDQNNDSIKFSSAF